MVAVDDVAPKIVDIAEDRADDVANERDHATGFVSGNVFDKVRFKLVVMALLSCIIIIGVAVIVGWVAQPTRGDTKAKSQLDFSEGSRQKISAMMATTPAGYENDLANESDTRVVTVGKFGMVSAKDAFQAFQRDGRAIVEINTTCPVTSDTCFEGFFLPYLPIDQVEEGADEFTLGGLVPSHRVEIAKEGVSMRYQIRCNTSHPEDSEFGCDFDLELEDASVNENTNGSERRLFFWGRRRRTPRRRRDRRRGPSCTGDRAGQNPCYWRQCDNRCVDRNYLGGGCKRNPPVNCGYMCSCYE